MSQIQPQHADDEGRLRSGSQETVDYSARPSDLFCNNCYTNGHSSKCCPKPRPERCFLCDSTMHIKANCPSRTKKTSQRSQSNTVSRKAYDPCIYCEGTDHKHMYCKKKTDCSANPATKDHPTSHRSGPCSYCCEPDHHVDKCPQEQHTPCQSTEEYKRKYCPNACHNCRATGHQTENCPKPQVFYEFLHLSYSCICIVVHIY